MTYTLYFSILLRFLIKKYKLNYISDITITGNITGTDNTTSGSNIIGIDNLTGTGNIRNMNKSRGNTNNDTINAVKVNNKTYDDKKKI
jgi:hypothetical protein